MNAGVGGGGGADEIPSRKHGLTLAGCGENEQAKAVCFAKKIGRKGLRKGKNSGFRSQDSEWGNGQGARRGEI